MTLYKLCLNLDLHLKLSKCGYSKNTSSECVLMGYCTQIPQKLKISQGFTFLSNILRVTDAGP